LFYGYLEGMITLVPIGVKLEQDSFSCLLLKCKAPPETRWGLEGICVHYP
jgi:hypothetical protein